MVYVVVACHFLSLKEVCRTTVTRLQAALNLAKVKDGDILVTGDVPYEPGGPTLGELMRGWLAARGLAAEVVRGGVGTFSEARIVCELLKNQEITVVSSSWYLYQGGPIWRRRARENNVGISFVSVPNTGGWRTKLTYAVFGVVIRVAFPLGLGGVLERWVTAFQAKRREGFTFDGCK